MIKITLFKKTGFPFDSIFLVPFPVTRPLSRCWYPVLVWADLPMRWPNRDTAVREMTGFPFDFILGSFSSDPSSVSVLVPGTGLGRLAHEVARQGYSFREMTCFPFDFILGSISSDPSSVSVLVPGTGLGRLAYEVGQAGIQLSGK